MKKRKKKVLKKPKLPPNEAYWLSVANSPKDINAFETRGNDRQKKYLKMVLDYKRWQIQQQQFEEEV